MPPPVKNYQRFNLWRCAFSANAKLRNYTYSDKPLLLTDDIKLTLQFPLNNTSWKRLQDHLEVVHPNFGMHKLIAATPLELEQEDAAAS